MKRRRRDVAFYAPWAGPNIAPGQRPSGGAEVQVLLIARGLVANGADVAVATYDVPGLPRESGGLTVLRQWRPNLKIAPLRRAIVLLTTVQTLLRCRARTLVQRSAGGTTGLVAFAARLTRTRFVYSSASTADFTFDRARHNRFTAAAYELGIRWADEIVVQTQEQVELCQARFHRTPHLIRSIAEPAEPRPVDVLPGPFLWIGRLVSYKNPLALLDLAEALPEAQFAMVCVPSQDAGLAALVEERAAALPNVELVGPLSRPDLMARVALATAIVSTSDFEGMPNTLLEGWSRGVPALTLSHDPDGLIARQALGRTAGGDPVAFIEQARELWATRDAAPWRSLCLEYVRAHHAPDHVADAWADVLDVPRTATAGRVPA